MKKINFLKGMLVVAILFIANLTVFAGNPGDNLIYNAEEVNGVIVSETIFKMEGTMLTNYMKHNTSMMPTTNAQRTRRKNGTVTKIAGKMTSAFVILMATKV